MMEVKDEFYHFKYIDIKYTGDISIDKELYRENALFEMRQKFYDILNRFNAKPKKETLKINADKILVRFIFSNYAGVFKKAKDGIFNYTKKTNTNSITDDITYVFANISREEAIEITNELNILKLFKKAISNIKKITPSKTQHYKKHNDYNTVYFNSLGNTHKFKMPMKIYDKLKNRYNEYKTNNKHNYKLDELIYILLLRYNTLDSGGHQWGMPLVIKDRFRNTLHFNFECFASALNHYYKYYCSMFYDIEKYFMSVGPFQNISYISGNYMANPPYEVSLLDNIVATFTKALKKSNNLAFMYGLPDWSNYDETLKFLVNSEKSEYYRGNVILEPYVYQWHDFMNYEKSHRIPQSLLYVLSTNDVKFDVIKNIMTKWKEL